jgi:hypothetical protein
MPLATTGDDVAGPPVSPNHMGSQLDSGGLVQKAGLPAAS